MGATYILTNTGNANASAKNFIAIYNGYGSGKQIRIWRVWIQNVQTSSITGGNTIVNLGRFYGAYTGGTAIISSAVSMDSTNVALPSQIVAASAPTGITLADLIRRICLFTDEFAVSNSTSDVLSVIPGLCCYLELGYFNNNLQPFVLAEGQGFVIQHAGSGIPNNNAVGTFDFTIEFDVI